MSRKIARRVAVLLLPQRAAIGEARLLARDELEQRRLAALGGLSRSGERAGDVLGPLDPLAPAAHGAPQIRVAPADVTGAVLVVRDDEVRDAARTRSSSARTLSRPAGRPPWALTASMNCRSTSRASPRSG